jgi:hypothetical protein
MSKRDISMNLTQFPSISGMALDGVQGGFNPLAAFPNPASAILEIPYKVANTMVPPEERRTPLGDIIKVAKKVLKK